MVTERSQGTTAYVLGIVGLFFNVVAPFAWKFGRAELKGIDEGRRLSDGHDIATAGRILGIIGTVLLVIALVVLPLALGLAVIRLQPGGREFMQRYRVRF